MLDYMFGQLRYICKKTWSALNTLYLWLLAIRCYELAKYCSESINEYALILPAYEMG